MTNKTSNGRRKKVVTGTVSAVKKGRTVARRAGEKVNALKKIARGPKV